MLTLLCNFGLLTVTEPIGFNVFKNITIELHYHHTIDWWYAMLLLMEESQPCDRKTSICLPPCVMVLFCFIRWTKEAWTMMRSRWCRSGKQKESDLVQEEWLHGHLTTPWKVGLIDTSLRLLSIGWRTYGNCGLFLSLKMWMDGVVVQW